MQTNQEHIPLLTNTKKHLAPVLPANGRIPWVDTLKGIAIFFIYVGHMETLVGKTYPYVFSFHVPLFFFVAGFFSKDTQTLSFIQYSFKQAKNILLPYYVFCLLNMSWLLLNNQQGPPYLFKLIKQAVIGSRLDHYNPVLWFLPALFLLKIIDFCLQKILKKPSYVFLFALALAILRLYLPQINFFSFYYVIGYLPYYIAGRLLFHYLNEAQPFLSVHTFLFILAAGISGISYFKGLGSLIALVPTLPLRELFQFCLTIFQIFFWVTISKQLTSFKLLASLGKNTLYLCGTEILNKELLKHLFPLLGHSFELKSPLAGYLFCLVALLLGLILTVPIFKQITLFVQNALEHIAYKMQKNGS